MPVIDLPRGHKLQALTLEEVLARNEDRPAANRTSPRSGPMLRAHRARRVCQQRQHHTAGKPSEQPHRNAPIMSGII
jgi:hypothetical protein